MSRHNPKNRELEKLECIRDIPELYQKEYDKIDLDKPWRDALKFF